MQNTSYNPLTQLKDEETFIFNSVLDFARKEIQPLVPEMDEKKPLESSVVAKIFELGLMAIEVPEKYGGAGGSFFKPFAIQKPLHK